MEGELQADSSFNHDNKIQAIVEALTIIEPIYAILKELPSI
jgi:hypothetical protein